MQQPTSSDLVFYNVVFQSGIIHIYIGYRYTKIAVVLNAEIVLCSLLKDPMLPSSSMIAFIQLKP